MPIFEYRCKECGRKFEIFLKSLNLLDEIKCPKCNSVNTEKLFSTFSSIGNASSTEDIPCCCNTNAKQNDYCTPGMCGLND